MAAKQNNKTENNTWLDSSECDRQMVLISLQIIFNYGHRISFDQIQFHLVGQVMIKRSTPSHNAEVCVHGGWRFSMSMRTGSRGLTQCPLFPALHFNQLDQEAVRRPKHGFGSCSGTRQQCIYHKDQQTRALFMTALCRQEDGSPKQCWGPSKEPIKVHSHSRRRPISPF